MTRRRVLGALVGLAGFAVAALLALSLYVSEQMARPPWYEHRSPEQGLRPGDLMSPAQLGLDYENVEFPAVDGSTLRGWWVPGAPAGRRVVVGVHGGGGDRRSFLGLAPSLHAAGYAVLLFDCREQGVSDGAGRGMSLGVREHEDVSSAVRYAREVRRQAWVAVIGSSQGATSAILAAAADPGIDAVIAQGTGTTLFEMMRANAQLAPFPDWMLRLFARTFLLRVGAGWRAAVAIGPGPHEVVDRIAPRPLFLIQGSEDDMAPASQARRNYQRAGEPKELWIVEGGGHRGLRTYAKGRYGQRVLAFLDAHAPAVD